MSPKSPEKPTRARKTENTKPTTKGSATSDGDTFGSVTVAKGASSEGGATRVVRLNGQRSKKDTEIKSKPPKNQTSGQFYNEDQSEDFSYAEDDLYENDDLSIGLLNNTRAKNQSNFQPDFETKSKRTSYPDLINKMLVLCVNEKDFIKGTCAGRVKSHYQKVFQTYKDKMEPRDKAIINSGLNYIYIFNRSNSIPKENAVWLISINDIPISHIVSYTSKNILKEIAKEYGISCSNKKAEELVVNIREAIEKN